MRAPFGDLMSCQPTKMPPPLARAFERLSDDVIWLHSRWILYRQLFGANPQRIELLNRVAPYFFSQLERILSDDVVLGICRLFDPATTVQQDNLVLAVLPNLIDQAAYASLHDDLAMRRNRLETQLPPFRANRNKRIAHRDYKTALDPRAPMLPGLSRVMFEEVLAEISGYLNGIQGFFDQSETAYDVFISPSDSDALIFALKQSVECARLEEARLLPFDWFKHSEFRDA